MHCLGLTFELYRIIKHSNCIGHIQHVEINKYHKTHHFKMFKMSLLMKEIYD